MLYVVGLGLGDEKDITVNGLEAVKKCERVYLEAYTSILGVPKERLEAIYGREVVVADREFVEQGIDGMLNEALEMDVAFLVRSVKCRPNFSSVFLLSSGACVGAAPTTLRFFPLSFPSRRRRGGQGGGGVKTFLESGTRSEMR